jgi:hypothetical protein
MIVMTRDPGTPAEFLLADFLSLDTPEGYRAELIHGEIVVTPPPTAIASATSGTSWSRSFAAALSRCSTQGSPA